MINQYDGTIDPDEYVNVYVIQMSLYTINNIALCRLLPTSLRGGAPVGLLDFHPYRLTFLIRS